MQVSWLGQLGDPHSVAVRRLCSHDQIFGILGRCTIHTYRHQVNDVLIEALTKNNENKQESGTQHLPLWRFIISHWLALAIPLKYNIQSKSKTHAKPHCISSQPHNCVVSQKTIKGSVIEYGTSRCSLLRPFDIASGLCLRTLAALSDELIVGQSDCMLTSYSSKHLLASSFHVYSRNTFLFKGVRSFLRPVKLKRPRDGNFQFNFAVSAADKTWRWNSKSNQTTLFEFYIFVRNVTSKFNQDHSKLCGQ